MLFDPRRRCCRSRLPHYGSRRPRSRTGRRRSSRHHRPHGWRSRPRPFRTGIRLVAHPPRIVRANVQRVSIDGAEHGGGTELASALQERVLESKPVHERGHLQPRHRAVGVVQSRREPERDAAVPHPFDVDAERAAVVDVGKPAQGAARRGEEVARTTAASGARPNRMARLQEATPWTGETGGKRACQGGSPRGGFYVSVLCLRRATVRAAALDRPRQARAGRTRSGQRTVPDCASRRRS